MKVLAHWTAVHRGAQPLLTQSSSRERARIGRTGAVLETEAHGSRQRGEVAESVLVYFRLLSSLSSEKRWIPQ